jgi:hypothetical protein
LRRAAKALGLKPRKTAFDGPWAWELTGEVGIRKSEVGEEEECGTGCAECEAGGEQFETESPGASEGGQRGEDGQVRVEKLATAAQEVAGRRTTLRQNEERARRYLELGEADERYDFSVFPVSRGELAKMAK